MIGNITIAEFTMILAIGLILCVLGAVMTEMGCQRNDKRKADKAKRSASMTERDTR